MIEQSQIIEVHNLIDREDELSYVPSARYFLECAKSDFKVETPEQGIELLSALFYSLLNADRYEDAAILAWGNRLFDPRPRNCRMIWGALKNHNLILAMGHGSGGKTYNGIAWLLLDWCRDPAYTNSKVVSTSEGHAKSNAWSKLLDFHRNSVIPLPGKPQGEIISLRPNDKQAAIALATVPQGPDSKARLQGFHPLPRLKPHPVFGPNSRVRALMDEAEKIATGIWAGIDNLLGNLDERGSVKVFGATNPEDDSSPFAQRAEPVGGWKVARDGDLDEWDSAEGWHVVRLNGAKSENVVERREVFHGLLTYEGFMNLARRGEQDAHFQTFALGMYPKATAQYNIVPSYITDKIRGTYLWLNTPFPIGSVDPAFEEGGDDATFSTGRYGLSSGWIDLLGKEHRFEIPRWVIQAEQQFELQQADTIAMGDQIKSLCTQLHIRPEWFVMDQTGNGKGLYDYLTRIYGGILGTKWGEAATDKRVLEEDSEPAEELYQGIVSEMWFAFSQWAEYDYVKFAPLFNHIPVIGELSKRHYAPFGGVLRKVETKRSYKTRTGAKSPDHADSMIMLVHLIRMRAGYNAAMLSDSQRAQRRDAQGKPVWMSEGALGGAVDKVSFVNDEN